MLFNSVAFAIFFPIVLVLYWAVPFRVQNWLLLAASYFFYGWWGFFVPGLTGFDKILPLLLLVACSLSTHLCAYALHPLPEGSRGRRGWFWLGVVTNLGWLGYFKYKNFFAENVVAVLNEFQWEVSPLTRTILLPAGISFYTFQGLSYLIDVYGGSEKPARKFTDFALFHAFFPQLVAGPIERTRNLLPQVIAPRTLTPEGLWTGLQLMLMGYVKKVAIADAIAPMTSAAFDTSKPHTGAGLLLGIYLFALQIYGDFSGYSDIARGAARLLGFELMMNFRQPYFSRNITEFWERWHVSLSMWLRDYIFVPLCRIFRGKKWMNFNLFLTMLISGLWHGASWNFVMWGGLLGLMLVIHKLWSGKKAGKHPHRPKNAREWMVQIAGMVLTFHAVCLTLIFVKTQTLEHAWSYFSGIFKGGYEPGDVFALVYVMIYGLVAVLIDLPCWWKDRELPVADTAPAWRRGVVFGALLLLLTYIGEMKGVSFVYFQF